MVALVNALKPLVEAQNVQVDVITTLPNRYHDFKETTATEEAASERIHIYRVKLPAHQNNFLGQARAFASFFRQAKAFARDRHYDLVFATSSRLFTAFLGARIAKQQRAPLALDIRDIFTETMDSVLKQPLLRTLCLPIFHWVERYTLSQAQSLNLVSRGFESYFAPKVSSACKLSYITNAVDECFVGIDYRLPTPHVRKRVLYAGNMGEGQGLEKIIPALAQATQDCCDFVLIGSGGREAALRAACQGLSNVQIQSPVKRERLIAEYQQADILFLHLNDYPAFKRVLPSKIFEYAVTGKPILAGVPGYAAQFVQTELQGAWLFPPCDTTAGVQQLQSILATAQTHWNRDDFCQRYSRGHLMTELAKQVLSQLPL